jgi:cell division protein FtsB
VRVLSLVLAGLILALQYPLWLGKGGWLKVWDMDRQVLAQKARNDALQSRNAGLEAEVADLKQGLDAVEERARYELGLVKPDEVFFQIVPPAKAAAR